jgi:hypothetical protein
MDLVQFYLDNATIINILVGVVLFYLTNKYALRENIRKLHELIDCLDQSLTDDNIDLREQKLIIEKARALVDEEFLMMLVKAITKTK